MAEPSVNPYAAPASEANESPLVAELVVDDAGLTLDYEILPEDIVEWNMYFHRTSATSRRSLRNGMIILGAAFLLFTFALQIVPREVALPTMLAVGILSAVVLALFPRYYRWNVRRAVRSMYAEGNNQSAFGRRRLSLLADYLVYSTPMSQTITRWAGIERIVVEPNVLYVLLSNVQALVVPRRAFVSDEQFQQFAAAASDLHARAIQRPFLAH